MTKKKKRGRGNPPGKGFSISKGTERGEYDVGELEGKHEGKVKGRK